MNYYYEVMKVSDQKKQRKSRLIWVAVLGMILLGVFLTSCGTTTKCNYTYLSKQNPNRYTSFNK
jgi:uncharacterized membrane protein YwaF